MTLHEILKLPYSNSITHISQCRSKISSSPELTNNITGKTYLPSSYEPLDCSAENFIYWIECSLCGLIYVGKTEKNISELYEYTYRQ